MKSVLKAILRMAGGIAAGTLVIAGVFLLFSTLTEFNPRSVEEVEIRGSDLPVGCLADTVSLVTWNLGYGGLSREMDFFYDGGKQVRPDPHSFHLTWTSILDFLKHNDSVDLFLLQEVDSHSRRSYDTDEVAGIAGALPGFLSSYAMNYNCRFVPVPPLRPMGRVVSGLVTASRTRPDEVTRYVFDNRVPWPKRLFYMKRCCLVSRFPLDHGRVLVVANIHNSAYDTGGEYRKREMETLRNILLPEYLKGHYVVAGGDWNANPPGFDPDEITTGDVVKRESFSGMETYFPGWTFGFDPHHPTNRAVDQPYRKGITPVTIIDYFLVSPNVRIKRVSTFSSGFTHSDHQPVCLEMVLTSEK